MCSQNQGLYASDVALSGVVASESQHDVAEFDSMQAAGLGGGAPVHHQGTQCTLLAT